MLLGERAFCGPRNIYISLSQICNARCIMCPFFSPLVHKLNTPITIKPLIDFDIFLKLVSDLKRLGTAKIILGGGGEPLLHPRIMDMVRFIDSLGMECVLVTSGINLTEHIAKEFSARNILLWLSLHAGSSDVWRRIHPGNSEADFDRLIQCISIISNSKKSRIAFHAVINNVNYSDVVNIIKLSIATGVKNVNFHPVRFKID